MRLALWLRRPKSVWLRKALFQIHLWTGIALGLYVFVISITGSAIVFRNELYNSLWPGPRIVAIPALASPTISFATPPGALIRATN